MRKKIFFIQMWIIVLFSVTSSSSAFACTGCLRESEPQNRLQFFYRKLNRMDRRKIPRGNPMNSQWEIDRIIELNKARIEALILITQVGNVDERLQVERSWDEFLRKQVEERLLSVDWETQVRVRSQREADWILKSKTRKTAILRNESINPLSLDAGSALEMQVGPNRELDFSVRNPRSYVPPRREDVESSAKTVLGGDPISNLLSLDKSSFYNGSGKSEGGISRLGSPTLDIQSVSYDHRTGSPQLLEDENKPDEEQLTES